MVAPTFFRLICGSLFMGTFFVLMAPPAYAYLDAGTASMIFQILAASLFGALFFFKTLWWKVKSFFRNLTGRTATDTEPDA